MGRGKEKKEHRNRGEKQGTKAQRDKVKTPPSPSSCTSCFGQRSLLLDLSAIRCSFFIAPAPSPPRGEGKCDFLLLSGEKKMMRGK